MSAPTRSCASAAQLRGARVLHVNATAFGGGVAEILATLVPLMNDVGLEADWQVIKGADEFFNVTKAHAQQPPGHVLRLDARDAGDVAALQPPQRRAVRRVRTTSSSSTTRSRRPSLAFLESAPARRARQVGLALPHRPHGRAGAGVGHAAAARRAVRRRDLHAARLREGRPRRPADLLRAAGDRPAQPEERATCRTRPCDAILARYGVDPAAPDGHADLALRSVEGPARRDRRLSRGEARDSRTSSS